MFGEGLCIPSDEDDTGHSLQVLYLHPGAEASRAVQDDYNTINGQWVKAPRF